jgi:hypothetical protein
VQHTAAQQHTHERDADTPAQWGMRAHSRAMRFLFSMLCVYALCVCSVCVLCVRYSLSSTTTTISLTCCWDRPSDSASPVTPPCTVCASITTCRMCTSRTCTTDGRRSSAPSSADANEAAHHFILAVARILSLGDACFVCSRQARISFRLLVQIKTACLSNERSEQAALQDCSKDTVLSLGCNLKSQETCPLFFAQTRVRIIAQFAETIVWNRNHTRKCTCPLFAKF